MDPEGLKMLQAVVGNKGKLIFAMMCGSYAYNMNTPTSDKDYLGVYIGNDNGPLFPPKTSFDKTSADKNVDDYCIYEIGFFFELLVKGNPKVIEPLYSEHYCWHTDEWLGLKKFRDATLNMTTASQYQGYAHLKAKEVAKDADFSKPAYHGFRLLKESLRILAGQPPHVFLTGTDREELMDIRMGRNTNREKLVADLKALETKVLEIIDAPTHPLPERLDTSQLGGWLVDMRIASLKASPLSPALDVADTAAPVFEDRLAPHLETAKRILGAHDLHAHILFGALIGGKAFGTSGPDGEDDVIIVYANPTRTALDMFSTVPIVLTESSTSTNVKYKTGVVMYEVSTFVSLIQQSFHPAIEAFFSPHQWQSQAWKSLLQGLEGGKLVVSQPLALHYLGIAEQLAEQTKTEAAATTKDGRKKLALAHRFLTQAKRILAGGLPDANVGAPCLASIATIKSEHISGDFLGDKVAAEIKAVREKRKTWTLPAKIDTAKTEMNKWLVGLRKALI